MRLTFVINEFPDDDDVSFVGLAKVVKINISDSEYFEKDMYYPVFTDVYDDSLCMADKDMSYENGWSISCYIDGDIEGAINDEICSANFEFIDKEDLDLFAYEFVDDDGDNRVELIVEFKTNDYQVELI